MIDRTPLEPPPIVIGVVGPPKVGKSTLVQCLIKNFTRKTLTNIQGPVTIVSGEAGYNAGQGGGIHGFLMTPTTTRKYRL